MPNTDKKLDSVNSTHRAIKSRVTKKAMLKIVVWIIILALVGFVSFTISRNKALAANRPAEKALAAVKANDSNAVYELGTDEFKKSSKKEQVKTVVAQWTKILNEATDGKPELVSKQESTKDSKQLTTLLYKYEIKPGKSKINQKELYVRVVTEKVGKDYKLYTFTIDSGK